MDLHEKILKNYKKKIIAVEEDEKNLVLYEQKKKIKNQTYKQTLKK